MPRDGAERVRAGIEAAESSDGLNPTWPCCGCIGARRQPCRSSCSGGVGGLDQGCRRGCGVPPDYVVVPLLASASALIGHARWAQATPGWSSRRTYGSLTSATAANGKSPGADCLLRDVLPEIERRMFADFPDRLQEWRIGAELAKAAKETWQGEVRTAQKQNKAPPSPPPEPGPEPQAPRLRQNDVTIERVATCSPPRPRRAC